MAEKLIRLEQLQRFKEKADAKYQSKLTAGNNIRISGNTISATAAPSNPTYTVLNLGSKNTTSGAITTMGSITLMPGIYFIVYTCIFDATTGTGSRRCGFSTSTTDITGFGRSWGDFRCPTYVSSSTIVTAPQTYTCVSGVFAVYASDYPNGRTFYFLAQQDSGRTVRAVADYSYVKLT